MAQKFLSDIHPTAGIKDTSGDLGTSGQVLSSTGSNTNWVNPTVGTTVIYKDAFTATNGQTAFTLANTVDSEDKTQVYIDGAYQSKGGYTVSGTTLTFDTGLETSSAVEVITFSTATANNAASAVKLDTFTGDGSDLTFVLSEAVVDEKVTQVYINGVYQNKSTYSIAADLVTLTFGSGNAPPNSSAIEVISFKTITSTDGTLTATTFLGDLNGTINTATTATTQSAGNNSTKISTTAYTDAKVAEAITNGTTGIAPSQDVVFDALALKATLADPTFTGTVGGITKAMVGLSNVDNTTDALKPVSTAGQAALDLKANIAGPTFTGDTGAANLTLSGYLRGPASFVIDPAAHGDETGTLVVAGNLQVDGTTTTINSTTVSIDDLNFSIATDAADSAAANGAGITIGGAGASLTYSHSGTKFVLNKPLDVTGAATFSGNINATNASSTVNIIATGINSGTNGGSSLIAGTTGVTNIAIGNKSALLGGAFDATSTVYWGNGGSLVFNNGANRLTISSNGESTISTTASNAQTALTLSTASSAASLNFSNTGTSPSNWYIQSGGGITGALRFYSNVSGSTGYRMSITSGGDVKIGDSTTDVTSKLTVSGNGSVNTATFMYDGNAGTYFDIDTEAANGSVILRADARSGNYPPMLFKTGGSTRLTISSGGLVQVGDGTSQNTFLTTKSVAGWASGIKLTRGLGDGSSTGNNNFGMLVTDNGWEVSTFTSPLDNTTGRSAKLVISSTGVATFNSSGDHTIVVGTGASSHNVYVKLNAGSGGSSYINSIGSGSLILGANGAASNHLSISSDGTATFKSGNNSFIDLDRNASGNAARIRYKTSGTDEFEAGLIGGIAGYHISDGSANPLLTIASTGALTINASANSTGNPRAIGFGGNSIGTNPLIYYDNAGNLVIDSTNSGKVYLNGDTTGDVNIAQGGGITYVGKTSNGGTQQQLYLAGYPLQSGSSFFGSYGFLTFAATTNYTGSARRYALTNAYAANKFAILQGGSSAANVGLGAGGSALTGTNPVFIIDGLGEISGDFNDTSDISLKKDIESLGDTTELVKKLNPVSFYWNEEQDKGENKNIGFIAQQVEEVVPELVKGDEGGKSINVTGLVSLLTKTVQEQQTIIEDLKARIETLEG